MVKFLPHVMHMFYCQAFFFFLPCPAEVVKLQRHLDLLRQEYVKLQNELSDVKRKYHVATAGAGGGGGDADEDNFVSRLLATVADLFDKELYR